MAELAIAPTTYRGLFASSFEQSQRHYLHIQRKTIKNIDNLLTFIFKYVILCIWMQSVRPRSFCLFYTILYYTMKRFCYRNTSETLQKPLYFFISAYETPTIRQFLLQKLTRNSPETLQKHNWPRENRVNPCDEISWPKNQNRSRVRRRWNDHWNSSWYPSTDIVWTARQLDFKQYRDKNRIPNMECDEKSIHSEYFKF